MCLLFYKVVLIMVFGAIHCLSDQFNHDLGHKNYSNPFEE